MRCVLLSCVRDEAPWLLEWVAYHRLIGFDRVVLYTNDCSDGTVALLDALGDAGLVERRDNPLPPGVSAQIHAASRVGEDPVAGEGDWVLWLDPDEYLNVHLGEGTLGALLARLEGAAGYAVHWRLFGDNGQAAWDARPGIARFTQAGKARLDLHQPVKTLFRWGPSIEAPSVHRPLLRPSFRARGLVWWHGPGVPVPEEFYYMRHNRDGMPALRLPHVTGQFAWAQINHYAVRSRAEFALKSARGSGVYASRHDEAYWTLYNRNDQPDRSILRHLAGLEALLADWRARPGIAAVETAALARLAPPG